MAVAVPPAEPGPSAIAGFGLFATASVAAGATVAVDADVLNHSCDPNLGWTDDRTLVAMRDIGPGAELTTDYALAISSGDAVLWCHCETYRCRQVIEGDDWRIPQLQQRYAGYWAPHIAERIAASLA